MIRTWGRLIFWWQKDYVLCDLIEISAYVRTVSPDCVESVKRKADYTSFCGSALSRNMSAASFRQQFDYTSKFNASPFPAKFYLVVITFLTNFVCNQNDDDKNYSIENEFKRYNTWENEFLIRLQWRRVRNRLTVRIGWIGTQRWRRAWAVHHRTSILRASVTQTFTLSMLFLLISFVFIFRWIFSTAVGHFRTFGV